MPTSRRAARFESRRCVLTTLLVVMQMLSSAPTAQSPQARPELVLQTGHTGAINAIALSSDGRFLVSGSEDSTIKLWDIATGNVLRTLLAMKSRCSRSQ